MKTHLGLIEQLDWNTDRGRHGENRVVGEKSAKVSGKREVVVGS